MCGIAGFTRDPSRSQQQDAAIVGRMLAPIAHRGPDDRGIHVRGGIAFGHLRLAIIDVRGGHQPRVDPPTGDALIFNGEIYGHSALAAKLRREGAHLVDHSDSEVLFHLLQRDGVKRTLDQIDGMFAFAFYEARTDKLYLVRDRFGEKPLYYCERDEGLVFGSEPSAVLAHPLAQDLPIDLNAVAAYTHFEYLPGSRSLYRDLRKLPPGSFLTYQSGRAEISCYWQPSPQERGSVLENEAGKLEKLDYLLRESVRERLVADVPVGVFLSGGIDSSLVAALVGKYAGGLTAFTISLPDQSYDEAHSAKVLAGSLGLQHRVIPIGNSDIGAAFATISAKMDEPLADASLLPTLALCTAARQEVTVALGGDAADELFAGYISFQANRLARLLALVPNSLGAAMRAGLNLVPSNSSYMSKEFLLRQLSHGCGLPPERQWIACMAPFAPEEHLRLWRHDVEAPDMLAAELYAIAEFTHKRDRKHWSTAELLLSFMQTYLPEDILQKVDRASMYVSLEVRSPFLARNFAEYAISLPSSDKLGVWRTKQLFRKLALRYIPAEIVNRKKHGFALPLARLLREQLKSAVGETLLDRDSPLREWFDGKYMEYLWCMHQTGKRDFRKKIWTLYCLATVVNNIRSLLRHSATVVEGENRSEAELAH